MPRAKTPAELREEFLDELRMYAAYWANLKDATPKERCDGLAGQTLGIFDGVAAGLPAFDLVARPHPDDQQFMIDEGENWIEDGTVITDVSLHDAWHEKGSDK